MSVWLEIQNYHAKRIAITDQAAELLPVSLALKESVDDHIKEVKELREEHHEQCFLVEHHMQVLMYTLRSLVPDERELEQLINGAAAAVKMKPWEEYSKAQREKEEREREAEEAKKKGDVPGQLPLFAKDGSPA